MYEISGLSMIWLKELLKYKKTLNSYFINIKKNRLKLFNFFREREFEVINSESNWIHVKLNKKYLSLIKNNNILIKSNAKLPIKDSKYWITISIPDDNKNYNTLINSFK